MDARERLDARVKAVNRANQEANELHACESGVTHEAMVYVGEIRDRKLTKIMEQPTLPADYTAEAVLKARAAYAKAVTAAEAARSALFPFDEYDR